MSVSRYSATLTAACRRWSSVQCSFLSTSTICLDDRPSHPGWRNKNDRPPKQQRWPRRRVAHSFFKPDEVNMNSPWSSIWQGPRAFDPFIVPFPIHMGYPQKGEDPPPPVGNLELMKIPNFLHLTPPAVHKHCEALKPLCTAWPKNLPTMPLKVETRNYVFPSHSVKHPGSKQVTIVFKLSDLNLSDRARKKMIKLASHRYKSDKGTIRLYAGRCPTRKQNYDYAHYLLKVLYLESNRVEPWELEIDEDEDDL